MKTWGPKFAVLVLIAAITYLLFFVVREDGYPLLATIAIAAMAWWVAHRGLHWRESLTIGILLRFGALFSFPLLSDDIYRFLWDGNLWLGGFHPLDFIPNDAAAVPLRADLDASVGTFARINAELLARMNSAGYYTVYPPISQVVFTFGAWLGSSITSATFWLKVPLFLGELGILRLLYLLEKRGNYRGLAAYALLPLPIVEVLGNAHFESMAVLGVLLALFCFRQNQRWKSGAWLGFGVLAKLVPLLAAPAITLAFLWEAVKTTGWHWKRALGFGLSVILTISTGMTIFLLPADLTGFGESLNLYFQKFEFNGSLYILASAFGEWYKGWNWIAVIGPSLSILSMLSILLLAFVRAWKGRDLATTLLFSFGVYILCATTVHPWYAIYLVALTPLTRYKWPYLLSFTVFLSYLAYGTEDIVVPVWATLLEYGSVFTLMLWELRKKVVVLSEK